MDSFQKIEQLADEVIDGKIGLTEALLSLPVDFSDCEGEMIEMETDNGTAETRKADNSPAG